MKNLVKSIMGCPCLSISSIEEAKHQLTELVEKSERSGYAVAINAEKIMRYQADTSLREIIDNSIFPSPDGAGAVLGMKLLWRRPCIKLDLPKTMLELANDRKWRLFIAGSTEEVNRIASERLRTLYPNIIISGRMNGYCDETQMFDAINTTRPNVVFLALGSPKQELVAGRLVKEMASGFVVGCGGALDVLAGRVSRAPTFMVEHNLEWLYRLCKDPSRWRRQLVLPRFLWSLLITAIRTKN